jgi:hypothetical protein
MLGDMPAMVMEAGEEQRKKARYIADRIAGLLVGWFVLLFCLELMLRGVLSAISVLFIAVRLE